MRDPSDWETKPSNFHGGHDSLAQVEGHTFRKTNMDTESRFLEESHLPGHCQGPNVTSPTGCFMVFPVWILCGPSEILTSLGDRSSPLSPPGHGTNAAAPLAPETKSRSPSALAETNVGPSVGRLFSPGPDAPDG